jgi:hypothetical protein
MSTKRRGFLPILTRFHLMSFFLHQDLSVTSFNLNAAAALLRETGSSASDVAVAIG